MAIVDFEFNQSFYVGVGVGALGISCLYILIRLLILIVSKILKCKRQATQYQPISKRHDDGNGTELQTISGDNVYVIDDEEAHVSLQPASGPATSMQLDDSPTIDPDEFQQEWSQSEQRGAIEAKLYPGSDVEKLLVSNNICCMASGTVGNQTKYYFFAQQGSTYFMIEIIISLTTYELVAKIRCKHEVLGEQFTDHLESILNSVADKS